MKIDIPHPPRTIMEVYKMLPEGTLAELINGQIFMSPSPTNQHQRVLLNIFRSLDAIVTNQKIGELFIAPSDVYLDDNSNAVQPDLYFISNLNLNQPKEDTPFSGVPDLVVEILSSKNDKHDRVTKKNLYEKVGVKEYWIVDPLNKETLVYHLKNNSYELIGHESGKAHSILFNRQFEF